MKRVLSTCALGLSLTLTLALAGCNRDKAPAAAPATAAADAPAIAMQKIDTVAGAGKEAVAGTTAVVNYTGWLYVPGAPQQHGGRGLRGEVHQDFLHIQIGGVLFS